MSLSHSVERDKVVRAIHILFTLRAYLDRNALAELNNNELEISRGRDRISGASPHAVGGGGLDRFSSCPLVAAVGEVVVSLTGVCSGLGDGMSIFLL